MSKKVYHPGIDWKIDYGFIDHSQQKFSLSSRFLMP